MEIEEGSFFQIELFPGGAEVALNGKNKEEFVKMIIKKKFCDPVELQISKFSEGFQSLTQNSCWDSVSLLSIPLFSSCLLHLLLSSKILTFLRLNFPFFSFFPYPDF